MPSKDNKLDPVVEVDRASEDFISPNDQVVVVLGDVGVGKSTFIQTLTEHQTTVGTSLTSASAVVSLYPFVERGQRVIMVDMPGLDDTKRSDAYTLATIASWLAASYSQKIIPAAILYLLRINNTRLSSSTVQRLEVYRRLVGDKALSNITLVTTHWPQQPSPAFDDAEGRENELATDSTLRTEFFLSRGAKLKRFMGDRESALEIIRAIPPGSQIPLQIQTELVDQRLGLQKTQAGRLVASSVREMVDLCKQTIEEQQKLVEQYKGKGDERSSAMQEGARMQIAVYTDLLAQTRGDQKALVADIWRKLVDGILKVFRLTVRQPDQTPAR